MVGRENNKATSGTEKTAVDTAQKEYKEKAEKITTTPSTKGKML